MAKPKPTSKRRREDDGAAPTAAKRTRYDYVNAVKVVAGKGEMRRIFVLHYDVVRKRSRYLKEEYAKLKAEDDEERLVELPEFQPEIFAAYAETLYHEDSNLGALVQSGINPMHVSNIPDLTLRVLRDCWFTGRQLQDTVFMDKAIDAMIPLMLQAVGVGFLVVFAAMDLQQFPTPRRLTVDILSRRVSLEEMDWIVRLYPDLAREVKESMLRIRDAQVTIDVTWQDKYRQRAK